MSIILSILIILGWIVGAFLCFAVLAIIFWIVALSWACRGLDRPPGPKK